MNHPLSPSPAWLQALSALGGLLAALWLGFGAISQQLPARPGTDSLSAPPTLSPCMMPREGFWKGRIFGTAGLDVDWRGADLACAGNARPGDAGLRLFFAGRPGRGSDRLVLVIGVPGRLDELAGREHAVSVTLIDEASSQFFHSEGGRCFSRIDEVAALPRRGEYRVEGELYCAGAIASVAGRTSVTLGDMRYAGRLTLDKE